MCFFYVEVGLSNYLLKNVFEVIVSSLTEKSTSLTFNGKTSTTMDGNLYYGFSDLFPMTGKVTDFDVSIMYQTVQDSSDTNIVSVFSVLIADSINNIPTDFSISYWGRTLDFCYNGNSVSAINSSMKNLEIKFESINVDMIYDYKDVKVELSSTASTDKEELSLMAAGNTHSASFARIVSSAVSGNNILEHSNVDSLVVTFRNPKLPLDTLRITVPFVEKSVEVVSAHFFDNSANGHLDSIFIELNSDMSMVGNDASALVNLLTLPAFRNITIDTGYYTDDGLTLLVTEGMADCNTAIMDGDTIVINTGMLAGGETVIAGTIICNDKMSPVIMTASLRDYQDLAVEDTLTVSFSEPIKTVTANSPFSFLAIASNSEYSAELTQIEGSGDTQVFTVKTISGSSKVENGDSIWINWKSDNIGDVITVANYQRDSLNIKREIFVENIISAITADYAEYFDNSADGHVDSIFISLNGYDLSEKSSNEFIKNIKLPDFRKFSIDSSSFSDAGLELIVTEKMDVCNTAVTIDDKILISTSTLLDGTPVYENSIDIKDLVAPVIISVIFIDYQSDSLSDTLTVTFSEAVNNITDTEPFLFWKTENSLEYKVSIKSIGIKNGYHKFEIPATLGGDAVIFPGDSIWINWNDEFVSDKIALRNFQINSKNIKREIVVHRIYPPVVITLKATTPVAFGEDGSNNMIPDEILVVLTNENKNELSAGEDGNASGMLIMVSPDKPEAVDETFFMRGSIKIYDPVGNCILPKIEMAFCGIYKSLVYVWNGKNQNGRLVGSGSYLMIAEYDIAYGVNKDEGVERLRGLKKLISVKIEPR